LGDGNAPSFAPAPKAALVEMTASAALETAADAMQLTVRPKAERLVNPPRGNHRNSFAASRHVLP
jgi:hypothetical protein